jgi:hypothetical protein
VTANPYESPTAPPERDHARKKVVLSILALLAIPASGIAGGVSCTGAVPYVSQIWTVAIAAGFVPMVAILSAAHYALRRSWKRGHGSAILGSVIVTPIALTIAGLIFVQAIMPVRPDNALSDASYLLIGSSAAFTVWSMGYWLGLSGRLLQFWNWLKK